MLQKHVIGERTFFLPNIRDEAGAEKFDSLVAYKPRQLAFLSKDNWTVLGENTRQSVTQLLELYDELKIPHINPNHIIYLPLDEKVSSKANTSPKELNSMFLNGSSPESFLPFISSPESDALSKKLLLPTSRYTPSSEIINNKYIAQRSLREAGVLCPEGKLCTSKQEALNYYQKLLELGYKKAALKLLRSFSGEGVFPIHSSEELESLLDTNGEVQKQLESGVLLDGWIMGEVVASPNIQYYVGDTGEQDVFIACSDQVLGENEVGEKIIHKGNISHTELLDTNPRLQKDLQKIRDWVRSVGGSGIIGVDFVIVQDGDTQKAYFMEINGRINGSTPGAILVDTLKGENTHTSWAVNNNVSIPGIETPEAFLDYLSKNHLLYHPDTQTGVIPTNFSAIEPYNKAMVVVIGNFSQQVNELLSHL